MVQDAPPTPLRYAGFSARLKAATVDFGIFLPLTLLSFWSYGESWIIIAVVNGCATLAWFAYSIVGHALWGQTVGKHVVGIRVRTIDARHIGWVEAWRRSAVDIVLGTFSLAATLTVFSRIPAGEFGGLGYWAIMERYDAMRPEWTVLAEYLYLAWLASEVVSVLFNRRRRALHDFIAGTIVTHELPGAIVSPPVALIGWKRALAVVDTVLVIVAFVGTAFFALAALGSEINDDPASRTDTLRIALYLLVVGGIAWSARWSLRRGKRWHWLARGVALFLLAVPVALLLLGV